jgi:hypothetical protein
MAQICNIPPWGDWKKSDKAGCKIPNYKNLIYPESSTIASKCLDKLEDPESRVFIQVACVPKHRSMFLAYS